MEIDLRAIAGAKKSEFTGWIKPHDGSDRLRFVAFGHSPHAPGVVLQTPARPLERVIDSVGQVRMSLVGLRRPADIDFTAIRQRQPNVDVVQAAGLVPMAGTFNDDPARRNAAIALFKLLYMIRDQF